MNFTSSPKLLANFMVLDRREILFKPSIEDSLSSLLQKRRLKPLNNPMQTKEKPTLLNYKSEAVLASLPLLNSLKPRRPPLKMIKLNLK
jgi:hypothetical protein